MATNYKICGMVIPLRSCAPNPVVSTALKVFELGVGISQSGLVGF